ncbi:MAG: hypothetical protein GX601_15280, partial [Anaerolineales bacterium]|nr:hypothetical protein [Anaerolineales bacterium]
FALVMPEFIRFVIGEKWLPMLWTFRLMLVYTALDSPLMLVDNLMMAVGQPHSLRRARIAQVAFFIPAVIVGATLWQINGVAVAADLMLLIGAWQLYRPLRQTVDFSLSRLALWPAIALAVGWGAGCWIETQLTCGWAGVLALKSAAFVALFGGLLLAVERDDYVRGWRWLREVRRT